MFVVYSNRQMLPIVREVEYDSSFPYRGFQEDIDIKKTKSNEDYYNKVLEEIDEEYIKEHTSD
ncbi:hypothetical protein [Clostridium aciditolerans]|uniref:Uncharacterized protein n=1 Tax=Clostridium aciditolerans TaxID=339861 RepID=A0A934I439_9CLOT|nr:hypothetical protein [Clostridium aciditolerans]MBI6875717.1 hypothetical protein [Clostridium aciditolerans]